MRFYRSKVLHFWRTQPGEKLKLSAQAVWMLWRPTPTDEGDGSGTRVSDLARKVFEPAYILTLYVLAVAGLGRLPRRYVVLTLLLLAYGTLMAMVFAGTMRYSAPWNFLLCIPAAFGAVRLWNAVRAPGAPRTAP